MYVINHFPSKVDFLLLCVLWSDFMNLRSGLVKTQWNETHRYRVRRFTQMDPNGPKWRPKWTQMATQMDIQMNEFWLLKMKSDIIILFY